MPAELTLDVSETTATLITVVFVLVVFFCFSIFQVPANYVVVVERFGQFHSVLTSGVHLVLWPIFTTKRVRWTYKEESKEGRGQTGLKTYEHYLIPVKNVSLDPPATSCTTRDRLDATINGTMLYQITDPHAAVYQCHDLLDYLGACVAQASRDVCAAHPAEKLLAMPEGKLSNMIIDQINERTSARGVTCTDFLIQTLRLAEHVMRSNEEVFAEKQRQRMLRQTQQDTHATTLERLAQQQEQQHKEAKLEEEKVIAQLELDKMRARAKAEQRTIENETEVAYIKSLKGSWLLVGANHEGEVHQGAGVLFWLLFVPCSFFSPPSCIWPCCPFAW
ncbi:hypothetical protein QOT17_003128 [Balamuthia mandrillaris]